MNEDWKKQAALLSEQARMDKQKEFQEKFLKLRQAEMDFQEEIKRKEQQETQKIAMKVAEMVDSLAKGEKLEAVFETNTAGLLYLANPVDLTDKVIKMYDEKKPAAKP
jgi:outer membrane protein